MTTFVAIVNMPGYLPMTDDPAIFDSAREAWEYLADERERETDDAPELDETAESRVRRDFATVAESGETGTVWAPTPGRDADDPHDLGLCYSVEVVTD